MWDWLLAPPDSWQESVLILLLAIPAVAAVLWLFERLGEKLGFWTGETDVVDLLRNRLTPFGTWLWQAAYEEGLFRLPLTLITAYGPLHGMSPGMPVAVIGSCLIFGAAHAGTLRTMPIRMLGHGLAGLVFVVLFMKAGGAYNHPLRAFVIVSVVHAAHNFLAARLYFWHWKRHFGKRYTDKVRNRRPPPR